MAKTWKRITAFALMVCMLLCAVPVMAFAEEPAPVQQDSITYQFGAVRDHEFTYHDPNKNKDITISFSDKNVGEPSIAGRALKAELERMYNAGESNWCYDSASAAIGYPNFNIYATGKNSEIYMSARTADQKTYLKDVWFAVRIQSPGTGEYKMSLNIAQVASGVTGSAYVLPGSVTDIDAALTEAAYVGSFSCYSATTKKNVTAALDNTVSLKAGKDYLLVFTLDTVNAEGASSSYLFMNSVTLDIVKNLDSITYDLYLADNTDLNYTNTAGTVTSFSGANIIGWQNNAVGTTYGATTQKMHQAIADYYEGGQLNWKFHATDFTHASMTTTHNSAYIYQNTFTTGNYFAVTVRSPGTGNYRMTVNHGQNKQGSTQGGIYLFDASVNPADWATTTPLFRDYVDYSRNANTTAVTSTVFDAAIPMQTGKEYTLVFTNEGAVNSAYGGSFNAMYLQDVQLNKVAAPQIKNTIEYDFRLHTLGLKFTNTAGVETEFVNNNIVELNSAGTAFGPTTLKRQEAIANYYADGTLNWKMHSATGSYFSIGANGKNDQDQWIVNWRSDSAYAYNKKVGDAYTAGHYFAMTVRSPGTGDYDVTLNYGTSANGAAQGSVYLLAADADLTTALTSENALGTVDFEEGTNAIATAATKTFGKSVTMEADKEYLLVFKCDQVGAVLNAMYLSSVVLKNTAPYIVDGAFYNDFNEANWAALDSDMTVKLNADVTLGEVKTADSAIDLNGYTLSVEALSGNVVDSSEGNTGLLNAESDVVVFSEDNADIPLYDSAAGGYRFFDYTLELYETPEAVGSAKQKFWFKFHFRTSDAADAPVDQDAYALVKSGNTGLQISTELTWAGNALDTVYFGRNYEGLETNSEKMDAFSKEWATFDGDANDGRWLYVVVHGLGADMVGELTVKPVMIANGVNISNGIISYTNPAKVA